MHYIKVQQRSNTTNCIIFFFKKRFSDTGSMQITERNYIYITGHLSREMSHTAAGY